MQACFLMQRGGLSSWPERGAGLERGAKREAASGALAGLNGIIEAGTKLGSNPDRLVEALCRSDSARYCSLELQCNFRNSAILFAADGGGSLLSINRNTFHTVLAR